MSPKYALLTLSAGIFAMALTASSQDQTVPAEKAFKNIQSFKGEPANSIIPAMQFISLSLKVGCDYCHVQDRSSDEKKEKLTAREMIAMTKDINAKNFGGRNQVTCATCHAGKTHPMNLPPVPGADTRARRSNDVDPVKVLADYQEAVGAGASQKITSMSITGSGVMDGKEAPLTADYSGNNFMIRHQNISIGTNGTQPWYSDGTHVYPLPPEVAPGFLRQSKIFLGADTLPSLNKPSGGTAKIDGKDVVDVMGTITGDSTRVILFFNKDTHLLVRVTYLTPTILGSIPVIVDYSDYKKVDGVEIPMTMGIHSESESIWKFKSVKANPKLDSKEFDPPKGS
ncbi:MAG TPA: photosynthetic reaction center cytochrome c subunit family protein [Fimbriimonadaceae bacterium]